MLYSKLFGKTKKDIKNYESLSHKLLVQAGFIDQVASGLFNLLPLGKRVLTKIENIIREELDKIEAQEIEMPLIHPRKLWEITNRWQTVEVLFKTKSQFNQEYALAPTHEETITPLVKKYLKSYKDLPLALYHITKKFRDEPRPKSGILRGREFGMKDLYSFHESKEDLHRYYQIVTQTYLSIFKRCGLSDIKITEASGGSFTKKFSHEFNVITSAGEVDLIYCEKCSFAQNIEISHLKIEKDRCIKCQGNLKQAKAIEIGNIFDLGTRFSEAFELKFVNKDGKSQYPFMGCYGIGTTRLLGAIVEVNNDKKGIIWPVEVSPYKIHLIGLDLKNPIFSKKTNKIYQKLINQNIEVLYDDRKDTSAGEKFYDADLIGLPIRLVISSKTKNKIEYKERDSDKLSYLTIDELLNLIRFRLIKKQEI